jgi:hypothetical protein
VVGVSNTRNEAIAVGVPVFSRTAALEQFLKSVPEYVRTVYVGDNGRTEDRRDLYERDWPWRLSVQDVPFDAGIGACRHHIANVVEEPYLWVGDCDMVIQRKGDLRVLRDILESHPDLGGVSGWLREGDTIRSGARQLVYHDETVYKTVPETPSVEADPVPFARFDMIPQCGLWRTAAFDTYTYDESIYNSEHIDFFWAHKKADQWDWASTPAVIVDHQRNIDPEYRRSKRGQNHIDFDTMARKWGFSDVQIGQRPDWITTRERSFFERGFDLFRDLTPPAVWVPVRRLLKGVGR